MAARSIAGFCSLARSVVASSCSWRVQAVSSRSPLNPASRSLTYRSSPVVIRKHLRAVRNLRCSAAPDTFDQNEVLKDAAKGGNLNVVNELLQGNLVNVDLPSGNRAGWTALHLACFYGHGDIVQSLLKAGANIEVRNDSGNTPLQLACLKGNIDIASTLLNSGADIHAESYDKGTALDYAQEWGGDEMVDFLLVWAEKHS